MSRPSFRGTLTTALLERRWITASLAVLMLVTSITLGLRWEQRENQEQIQHVSSQARILAGTLTGALAFDDYATAEEYVDALRVNSDIRAAAVYDEDGALVLGFARGSEVLPPTPPTGEPRLQGRLVSVVAPVEEGALRLGHVYLRSMVEPLSARLARYLAIGIVLLLAALLIAILGAANAAAAAANRELQKQVRAREEAEAALLQAQKMEALGQLTGGVAHDFNNLLMAASSGLELLDRAKSEERRDKLKHGIRDALARGARITEQLLAFSRRRPLKLEVVRLDEHMGKLAELLDHSLRENIDVRFAIPPETWPVEVDLSQFDIAILNLAVNAKDAMPRGGQICIMAHNRPGVLEGQDAVEIVVEDEGSGMTAEAVDKAFEPFFTTKDVGRGTGLGLSQVYGFVRAAGGTVAIDSEIGRGTEVHILLPRSTREPPGPSPDADRPATDLAGTRVLLVEDDPALNELLCTMLEGEGCTVIIATAGTEGLEKVGAHTFDVVLSDMVMPGRMGGLDLARAVRRQQPDLPVVLMTGYSEAAGAASAEGYPLLRKPFGSAELVRAMAQALETWP